MHLIIDGTNQLKNEHAAQVRIATSQTFANKVHKLMFICLDKTNNISKGTDDPNKYAHKKMYYFWLVFF